MASPDYAVVVVVERDFGERLVELARLFPVWACDTPGNRSWIELVWNDPESDWEEQGISAFKVADDVDPETMFLDRLGEIDLHHGAYAHEPAWSRLVVFGIGATPAIRAALVKFGVDAFDETLEGFVATRPTESSVT